MSSGAASARAPLLGANSLNDEQDQKSVHSAQCAAISDPHNGDDESSSAGQLRSSAASADTAQQDQSEDHSTAATAGGSTGAGTMKYRRFRTPVNFVMFRTPTLRTEATQINTINGTRLR